MPSERQLKESVVSYSTQENLSYKQQLLLLERVINKSSSRVLSETEQQLLAALQQKFKLIALSAYSQDKQLEIMIGNIKEFIARLEQNHRNSELLKSFVENGLYRIIYHHPKLKGVDSTDILPTLLQNGFIGVGVSAAIVILFTVISFIAVPAWITAVVTALFASAMTYISAILYGVINDIFATRANLPYFLLGHQPQQHSLLRTNDPVAQGIAWGVAATFGPALLASIGFGVATLITASFVPVATFVFPAMLIAMPLIAYGADIFARKKAMEYVTKGLRSYDLDQIDFKLTGLNDYQKQGLTLMSSKKEEKAAWFANSDRNMFGFTKLPLIGLGALAGIIILSVMHASLPAVLFSTALVTVMPVAFAAVAVLALAAAGVYTYVNRNKQIDNRYKLAFDMEPKATDTLYLDEDMELVAQLGEEPMPKVQLDEPKHYSSPIGSQARSGRSNPNMDSVFSNDELQSATP